MQNMWFTGTSPLKLCIPAAVLYSTILASKCRGDDGAPGQLWRDGDESIHIYRTEIPWKPIELDSEKNTFAIVAWTAVLSVSVSVAAILCLCGLCWKLYPKYGSRRQSSNVALVPGTSVTVMEFPATLGVHGRATRGSRRGNRITNFASMGRPGDSTPSSYLEDGPPAYSTVISQTLTKDRPTSTLFPPVNATKTLETPPPAYITIAPFQ